MSCIRRAFVVLKKKHTPEWEACAR